MSSLGSFNLKMLFKDEDEGVESYALGKEHLIFWTDTYAYKIVDFSGTSVSEGQLEGMSDNEDALPLTQINCNWFCAMDDGAKRVMFVRFIDLTTADICVLDTSNNSVTVFCAGLKIERAMFHNFCWLNYNVEEKSVQLAYSTETQVKYFRSIGQENPSAELTIECANPNIFFQKDNTMMMANNFKDSTN